MHLSSKINRTINILTSNSFFLFGARGTGKTTLLKELFPEKKALWLNLLDPAEEDLMLRRPNELAARISHLPAKSWVIIDEVQKAPKLLNIVHEFIESKGLLFGLTGSNARRLKQKGVNLLAGRAFTNTLFPFSFEEVPSEVALKNLLEFGSLPKIFAESDTLIKNEYLRSYGLNYITQEIQAEQWVRKIEPFRKFLPVAAQMNGKILNYSKIAREIGVDTGTVISYFDILEDTYVGYRLEAFHESIRKRQQQSPKFYLFDLGVKRALEGTLTVELLPKTYAFGAAFEHLIVCETIKLNSYHRKDFKLSYLQTKDHAEVDLLIERPGKKTLMVEIKSADEINRQHLATLKSFSKVRPHDEFYLLSRDPNAKIIDGVKCLHWQRGLREFFVE